MMNALTRDKSGLVFILRINFPVDDGIFQKAMPMKEMFFLLEE